MHTAPRPLPQPPTPMAGRGHLILGPVRIDLDSLRVWRGDAQDSLTPLEAELLRHLASADGSAVPRREIEREIWGMSERVRSDAVPVAIRRLRAKIEPDPAHPALLLTVRGFGWRLALSDAPTPTLGSGSPVDVDLLRALARRGNTHLDRGEIEDARICLREALDLLGDRPVASRPPRTLRPALARSHPADSPPSRGDARVATLHFTPRGR
jgi:DNA-binding winged helix-turn-helix (wHTH) protein